MLRLGTPKSDRAARWPARLLLAALHALARPHELVARKWGTTGRRYATPAVTVAGCVAVPPLFALLVPPAWGGAALLAAPAVLLALAAAHRAAGRRGGDPVHPHYPGDPWRDHRVPRYGEWVGGLWTASLGFALCPTVGAMLLASSVASELHLRLLVRRGRRAGRPIESALLGVRPDPRRLREGSPW